MKRDSLIIIESTVAPGTTNYIVKPILEEASSMKAGTDFSLVFSYERVMVGRLLKNLIYIVFKKPPIAYKAKIIKGKWLGNYLIKNGKHV